MVKLVDAQVRLLSPAPINIDMENVKPYIPEELARRLELLNKASRPLDDLQKEVTTMAIKALSIPGVKLP